MAGLHPDSQVPDTFMHFFKFLFIEYGSQMYALAKFWV